MTILILSLRLNVETEAIPSQATLVFGLLRYARNDKSLERHTTFAMTICNRWPRRLTRLLAMTSQTVFAMTIQAIKCLHKIRRGVAGWRLNAR